MNTITNNKTYLQLKYISKRIKRFFTYSKPLIAFNDSKDRINKIFIINLDRQTDRWSEIKKELKRLNTTQGQCLLNFSERFSAIDARELSTKNNGEEKINTSYKIQDQFYVDPDPRLLNIIREQNIEIALTKEEIAVALSHISTWEKIVLNDIPYALVLEDDVYFESDFSKILNDCWNEITTDKVKFDLLFLSFKEVNHNPEITEISTNLSTVNRGIWWFSGYVLSLEGAKQLLQRIPVVGPIDLWANHQFNTLKVYCSNKSIINQKLHISSDNNYSILPVLSQIGIKSDKTFIDLDKLKGRNPVFIFDLCEDSAKDVSRLNTLLSLNTYRTYINRSSEDSIHVFDQVKKKETLLFDAYLNFNQLIHHISEIVKFHPSSVFVLIKDKNTSVQEIRSDFMKWIDKKKVLLIDSKSSDLCKKVSNFLKIKHWELDTSNLPENYLRVRRLPKEGKIQKIYPLDNYAYLEHDVNPWIIPIHNIDKYLSHSLPILETIPLGAKHNEIKDHFKEINPNVWSVLEETFPSNLAYFTKDNLILLDSVGIEITINKKKLKDRNYTSASIVSKERRLYGSFEIKMKPVKGNGIISAFFLHRNDPWQEIDIEFLGNDTTKILLNVYFNPGIEDVSFNYGVRGTPILIDLGFDASEDFHIYKIEWEPHEIRWYVDNRIIHIRKEWTPCPIPNLPLAIYVNTWVTKAAKLAGQFEDSILPCSTIIKNIAISQFKYD